MILAATLAVPLLLAAPEPGLELWYSFDEAAGEQIVDQSGHDRHGTIRGATRVDGPHGKCLRFDGVDDYVDAGPTAALGLHDDLTVEAWFRADRIDQRNRLIIGDAASRTIHRNFSLRIDSGDLRFEHGNDQNYGAAVLNGLTLTGGWHHVAVICEMPRRLVYFDGKLVGNELLDPAIAVTKGAELRLGGWFAGWFQGDLDEVRLYSRALPETEILQHAGKSPADVPPVWQVLPAVYYTHRRIAIRVFASRVEEVAGQLPLRLTDAQGKVVKESVIELPPSRPGSHRAGGEATLEVGDLKPGAYRLQVGQVETEVRWPERPRWLGSEAGRTDEVLKPFTPVEVMPGAEPALGVWGRNYRFGRQALLSQITSGGQPLLAAPAEILAQVGGLAVKWPAANPEVLSQTPSQVRLKQTWQAGTLQLTVDWTLHYDGFLECQWSLNPLTATTLDSLAVELPLPVTRDQFLYTWPVDRSGSPSAPFNSRFKPILWLGNDQRGLSWFSESDQDYDLAEPDHAITTRLDGDRVVLRITQVDHPVALSKGQSRSYWFALQATPLKPFRNDLWQQRIVRNPWYGYSLDMPDKQVDGQPAFEHFQQAGARAMLVLRWWDAFSYTSPLGHEAEFKRLVTECHAHGLKVVPYIGGFLLSEKAPEWSAFAHNMAKSPWQNFPINRMPGMASQNTVIVCHHSDWQDFLVDGVARLVDEYDVDGIYLDTTCLPWACRNAEHGCGYTAVNGTQHETYPIRAIRTTFQRMYAAVKARKPDGLVDLHVYDAMNSAALAYATSYWNGEQLPRGWGKDPRNLSLGRFRTEFAGRNWGVPSDLLYYVVGNVRAATGWALLHDVPTRVENLKDLELSSKLWRLREQFGCEQAEFLPYYRNQQEVATNAERLLVSLYRHQGHGVLVVAANLESEPVEALVKLELARLDLAPTATVLDGLTLQPAPETLPTLTVKLAAGEWRVWWLRP